MKNTTIKHVLTGGPGTGKTTLINLLVEMGYDVVPEAARYVIEQEQFSGGDALPWKDNDAFQDKVLSHQLFLEDGLDSKIAFLDRGIVDGYGYSKHFGNLPSDRLIDLGKNRYGKIFLLDRLPNYQNDAERLEDFEDAGIIHSAIEKAYVDFGYQPIRVPVLSPEERIDFILNRI